MKKRKNNTSSKFNLSIADRIDKLRKAKSLSWGALAYISGVSKGGMSEIKNGLIEPKLSTLCKIAAGLDMSPVEFLSFNIDTSEFAE